MTEELYKRYRPKTFKAVLGQDEAVKMLTQLVITRKVPHALLFTGPSGCGKTTLARILRRKLHCGESDFFEVNVADFRGIDMVRDIRSRMSLSPISGECRMWLVDEAAKLTSDGQDAFLKILEDTPSHVYFILCTTDPQKLKRTIITRCTEVNLRLLPNKTLDQLIGDVSGKEQVQLYDDVRDKIVSHAEGSARKALVLLNQVMGLKTEEEQLEAVEKGDYKAQAIELARALIKPRADWAEVSAILKSLDEEAEGIRRMLLGYCQSVLLGGGKLSDRAYMIIDALREPLYDIGKPGLVAACWEVVKG
jgi:DNA polymerase-3 subunit gamma/tau